MQMGTKIYIPQWVVPHEHSKAHNSCEWPLPDVVWQSVFWVDSSKYASRIVPSPEQTALAKVLRNVEHA